MSGNLIDAAADRLRGRWCKGSWDDQDGNVCMSGAINQVVADYQEREAAKHLVAESLIDRGLVHQCDPALIGGGTLLGFNDRPDTTEEDVLLAFKHASALYDERHPS